MLFLCIVMLKKTPDTGNSPAEMFMSFGDLEIAKQLTLRDFRIYSKVQVFVKNPRILLLAL